MAGYLRKNTTTTVAFGPLVAASDGYTYLATTITFSASCIVLFKTDGSVTGLPAGNMAMPRPGWVLIPVAASDVTAAGRMTYTMGNFSASGNNMPVFRNYTVLPENKYDSMHVSTSNDEVDVVQINGSSATNTTFNANVIQINGAAPTAITFNANIVLVEGGAVTAAVMGANVRFVTSAAPSNAFPGMVFDHVLFTPLGQTITVRDVLKNMAAVLLGKSDGATGTSMRFYGPSGNVRVSAALASGNRTGTTWVTG